MSENCMGLILLQNIYKSRTKYVTHQYLHRGNHQGWASGVYDPRENEAHLAAPHSPRAFPLRKNVDLQQTLEVTGGSDLCVTKK